jgi:hypothetical protein
LRESASAASNASQSHQGKATREKKPQESRAIGNSKVEHFAERSTEKASKAIPAVCVTSTMIYSFDWPKT